MKSVYNHTAIAFAFNIILTAFIGIFLVQTVTTLSTDTTRLYNHPYAVSNAARDINTNLISMHRYMKDVALSKNATELEKASLLVSEHEQYIFRNFEIIYERFLGDKQKVYQLNQEFIAWREIRNEVIALKRSGKHELAADITKGKGAEHVAMLSEKTQEFVVFAASKAAEFHQNSQKSADDSIVIMSSAVTLVIIISLLIAIHIVRKQTLADKEIDKRSHLIDQNIMMAQLDETGHILDISNALCRYLEVLRTEMLDQPSHFFLSIDDIEEQEENIWRKVKSGAQWEGEVKHVTRNSTIQWSQLTILPELDSEYKITGYSCILQDLTSKKASLTDNLTKLGNRRQFNDVLDHEIKLVKRNGNSLTLAIIDVDFFKKYNDFYGHPAGDEALTKVGRAISSKMRRPDDYAFRIGGEEFAVLISGMEQELARNYLDEIRNTIETLKIPHSESDVSEHLTISIGAVTQHDNGNLDSEHLYIDADKALYLAKESRNVVAMSWNPQSQDSQTKPEATA